MTHAQHNTDAHCINKNRFDLAVCVCLKNRSRVPTDQGDLFLFPNCVDSLREASIEAGLNIELIVVDCELDDWPVEHWLVERAHPLKATIIKQRGVFSKGKAVNTAVAHASCDHLFLCDADMLVSAAVLCKGLACLRSGMAYFPIFRDLSAEGAAGEGVRGQCIRNGAGRLTGRLTG